MKNLFKVVGIIALVAIMGFAVVACSGGGGGKLSGDYKLDAGDQTYSFSGNKVTASSGGKIFAEGTFTTSNDQLTLTVNGESVSFKYSLEGKKLILGEGAARSEYTKQ